MLDIKSLNKKNLDTLLTYDKSISLIFTQAPEGSLWVDLNELIFSKRKDHVICLWGGSKYTWKDLSFLKLLNNLQRLRIKEIMLSGNDLFPIKYIEKMSEFYIDETCVDLSIKPLLAFKDTLEALFISGKKEDEYIIYDMNNLILLSLKEFSFLDPNNLKSYNKLKLLIIEWNDHKPNFEHSNLKYIEYLEINGCNYKWSKQDYFNFPNLKILTLVNFETIVMPIKANLKSLGRLVFKDCKNIENLLEFDLSNVEEIALYGDSNVTDHQIEAILNKFNIKVLYTEKINVGVNEIINTNAMLGRIIDQQDSIAQKYIQLTKLDWHSTK